MSDLFRLHPDTAALVAEIQRDKYMQADEATWGSLHRRVSSALFANDPKRSHELRVELDASRACPAGRVLAGAGTAKNVTWWNCFVAPLLQDSMRTDSAQPGLGIMDCLASVAYSMQMGGGVGTDFSPLRPEGAMVRRVNAPASGPLAFMDMWDGMCRTIMSAGYRRGAMMATLRDDHPDLMKFVTAKHDGARLRMFNVSVLVSDAFMSAVESNGQWELGHWSPPFDGSKLLRTTTRPRPGTAEPAPWYVYEELSARQIWRVIMESTYKYAEPGVIFIDRVNRMNNLHYCEYIQCTNPCVVGETLIAVAGRGAVPIAQLAKEGKDVPVFSCNIKTGETVVRWGRNPRLTKKNAEVVRVLLDDGSSIRCTPDHKFPTRDGRKVEARNLISGDSLFRFDGYKTIEGNSIIKRLNNKLSTPEYHLIAESKYSSRFNWGRKRGQYHCHHIDGNHQNNSWINIEVKLVEDHNSDHKIGDGNPMRSWWSAATEEEKEAYRAKMSVSTSGEHNGMWGRKHSSETLAKIGAKTKERLTTDEQRETHGAAVRRGMTDASRNKIRAAVERGTFIIDRNCATCEKPFTLRVRSESSIQAKKRCCSKSCALVLAHREHPMSAEKRVEFGKMISAKLKGKRHSPEHTAAVALARRTGAYRAGSGSNHKVVSVTPDGYADVYNLTVDEHHNYAAITSSEFISRYKHQRFSGVFYSNCGEQALSPDNNCNLSHVNLSRCTIGVPFTDDCIFDLPTIRRVTALLVRMSDNVIDLSPVPTEAQREQALAKRRIGLGITGLANALMFLRQRYGSLVAVESTERVMEAIKIAAYAESIALAKERGPFPLFDRDAYLQGEFIRALPEDIREGIAEHGIRNALLLTVAPTGTVSIAQADNSSGGLEPVFLPRYNRRVLQPDGSYKESVIEDLGFRVYANALFGGDMDVALAASLPDYMVTTDDLTPEDHLQMQAAVQKHIDNSVSKTINVPEDTPFDDFISIYRRAYDLGCKGCTTYRPDPDSGRGAVLSAVKDRAGSPNRSDLRERPEILEGRTYRLRWSTLPYPMFLTVNDEIQPDGRRIPFEVFINSKAVDYAHWVSALTRTISAVMRKGGDLSFLPEELKAVWSARGGEFIDKRFVPSEVALIGLTLERHFKTIGYHPNGKPEAATGEEIRITGMHYAELGIGEECPSCGALQVIKSEGCKKCLACEWSNCA